MTFIPKLCVEGKETYILDLAFGTQQAVYQENNKPVRQPIGTILEIVFQTTTDQTFKNWEADVEMTKYAKIVISPSFGTGRSNIIELFDTYCVHLKNKINKKTGFIQTKIYLIPSILTINGGKLIDYYWNKNGRSVQGVTPTVIEQDKKLNVVDIYYEDKEGNRIEYIYPRDVVLVLKTKNARGKKIDIDLQDREHTYIHEGERAKNSILKQVTIVEDTTKIKLRVLPILLDSYYLDNYY